VWTSLDICVVCVQFLRLNATQRLSFIYLFIFFWRVVCSKHRLVWFILSLFFIYK
jgi:hypothetical protein